MKVPACHATSGMSRSLSLLAPCGRSLRSAFAAPQGPRSSGSRRSLVCLAREKAVGSILRNAITAPPRAPDLAYQSAAAYLRALGITNQSELTMVLDIAMNPYSVYGKQTRKQPANPHARKLSVEDDMRPVVEFLRALELDQAAVAGLVCRHPAVLCYSVEGRLAPFVDYLVGEVGLAREQVAKAIQQRPNILGLELEGVRRIVGYLADNGKSMDEIAHLLTTAL